MTDKDFAQEFSDFIAKTHKETQTEILVLLEKFLKYKNPKRYNSKGFYQIEAIQFLPNNHREIGDFLIGTKQIQRWSIFIPDTSVVLQSPTLTIFVEKDIQYVVQLGYWIARNISTKSLMVFPNEFFREFFYEI